MSRIIHDLEQLVQEGVIDVPTADRIRAFYLKEKEPGGNKLTLIFSIVGALLVGLGILLIVAHNWDQWSNFTRTIVALIPTAIGQFLVAYTLFKKRESSSWNETAGIFLTLSLGASLVTISQIYHLSGSVADLMFAWLNMTIPLLYLLESTGTMVLFLVGIAVFMLAPNWMQENHQQSYFWLFTGLSLPLYWKKIVKQSLSNSTLLLHLIYAILILVVWHVFIEGPDAAFFWQYWLWCILYLLLGQWLIPSLGVLRNAYVVIGSLGNLWLWTIFSFKEPWREMLYADNSLQNFVTALHQNTGWLPFLLTLMVSIWMLFQSVQGRRPFRISFIYFFGAFLAILISKFFWIDFGFYFANLMLLLQAMFYIIQGNKENHLGWLNYGLLWMTVWIVCRFFDLNLDYIWRGILFLVLGLAFFGANWYLIRVRKMKLAKP